VESRYCVRTFALPVPARLDDYRKRPGDPVDVMIGSDYTIHLIPKGKAPDSVTLAEQPAGYPVTPASKGERC
jgi:hypothetical protein